VDKSCKGLGLFSTFVCTGHLVAVQVSIRRLRGALFFFVSGMWITCG
jgi:hypothetical protein